MAGSRAGFGIAVVVCGLPAIAAAQPRQPEPSFVSQLVDAREHVENRRYAAADVILNDMLLSEEFSTEEPGWRSSVYAMSAEVAIALGDEDRVREMIRQLAAQPDSDPEELLGLVEIAHRNGSADLAVGCLTLFARAWPEALPALNLDTVAGIVGSFSEESLESELWIKLVAALDAANTATMDLAFVSSFWERIALAALQRDETQFAFEAVTRIPTVLTLIAMQVDDRFGNLVVSRPELFDVGAATQREISAYNRQATANPRRLAPRVRLARSLRRANRLGEALAIVNMTIDRLLLPKGDPNDWDDVAYSAGSLLGEKANILRDLGRSEESIAQLEQARLMPELNGPNITQAYDLAQYYARAGMVEEAAALADELRELSVDAARVTGVVDLMIAVQQGDSRSIEIALDRLAEAREGSRALDVLALLLGGRLDDAADSYKLWLDAPESRSEALLFLQNFIVGSDRAPATIFESIYWEQRSQLRARPDVQAAVAAVGRFDSFAVRYE